MNPGSPAPRPTKPPLQISAIGMRFRRPGLSITGVGLADIVLIPSLAFIIGACEKEPPKGDRGAAAVTPVLEVYTVPVDTVLGQTWASAPVLKLPRGVAATSRYVAIADLGTDSVLILFDSETGRFIGATGGRQVSGRRFFRPTSIQAPQDSGDGIKLYDPFMQALAEYRSSGPRAGYTLTEFGDSLSIMQPLHLADGRFLSTGLRVPGRVGLFAGNGKLLRSFGEIPAGTDTLPLFIRQHAYQSLAALHPKRSHVALLTRYADQLEMFDTVGSRLPMGYRPFRFDPIYEVGIRGGAPALGMIPSSRIGYVDAAADSQHIYGLFAGRAIGAFASRAYDALHVHIFSWSGRLERVVRLSHPASFIAVSPDGRRLFAVSTGNEPALRMYALSLPSSSVAKPRRE